MEFEVDPQSMHWNWELVTHALSFIGVVIVVVAGAWTNRRNIKAANEQLLQQLTATRHQKLVDDLQPVLSQIIDDVHTLQRALCFKGRFCPPIESRCPSFSQHENDGDSISYASRTFEFRSLGYNIARSCRRALHLTQDSSLRETLTYCREIKKYLVDSEPGNNSKLEFLMNAMASHLAAENGDGIRNPDASKILHDAAVELRDFQIRLEAALEKELPALADKLRVST